MPEHQVDMSYERHCTLLPQEMERIYSIIIVLIRASFKHSAHQLSARALNLYVITLTLTVTKLYILILYRKNKML